MSVVKENAIRHANIVKQCEAEEEELNKKSSTDASTVSKLSQVKQR